MNCQHSQHLISALIDQELDFEEKRLIRKHLVECAACHSEYEQFLQLKDILENLPPVNYEVDSMTRLKIRITNDEHSLFAPVDQMFWVRRLGLIATCSMAFLITSLLLFPSGKDSYGTIAKQSDRFQVNPASSFGTDQSISIDQSFTVYQASSTVLP